MDKIRVVSLCSGYDAPFIAMKRLKADNSAFDFECIGWSEVDKYAIIGHNAIHPEMAGLNMGDMTLIDWTKVSDFDLLIYSTPCQSVSSAGKREGVVEGSGTKSSLLWDTRRGIIEKRPKFLLGENVRGLIEPKNIAQFKKWLLELESYGYKNFVKVLDSQNYGIAQHRPRVFTVSLLGGGDFEFPKPIELTKCMRDYLEDNVEEKYYLSDRTVNSLAEHCERKQREGCGFKFQPTDGGGYCKDNQLLGR